MVVGIVERRVKAEAVHLVLFEPELSYLLKIVACFVGVEVPLGHMLGEVALIEQVLADTCVALTGALVKLVNFKILGVTLHIAAQCLFAS